MSFFEVQTNLGLKGFTHEDKRFEIHPGFDRKPEKLRSQKQYLSCSWSLERSQQRSDLLEAVVQFKSKTIIILHHSDKGCHRDADVISSKKNAVDWLEDGQHFLILCNGLKKKEKKILHGPWNTDINVLKGNLKSPNSSTVSGPLIFSMAALYASSFTHNWMFLASGEECCSAPLMKPCNSSPSRQNVHSKFPRKKFGHLKLRPAGLQILFEYLSKFPLTWNMHH